MKLLVLNQSEIEHLLPMHECITVMTDALMALASVSFAQSGGKSLNPM